jgi:Sec-independent protein secretion pathway component TatC
MKGFFLFIFGLAIGFFVSRPNVFEFLVNEVKKLISG